ncbi:hypothetical protein Pyn_36626 [Prunus yedoensis var. nudiflora]|uniref:Uncharacterized protein n=1 Tax=Prunus yedoensis var. nudiflora TaxID=2094558 RepID=A0A314YW63_PRUYE|nr:hypothetical protein Pyn_36626 [Prunus yedoensis var. nudiflora]
MESPLKRPCVNSSGPHQMLLRGKGLMQMDSDCHPFNPPIPTPTLSSKMPSLQFLLNVALSVTPMRKALEHARRTSCPIIILSMLIPMGLWRSLLGLVVIGTVVGAV